MSEWTVRCFVYHAFALFQEELEMRLEAADRESCEHASGSDGLQAKIVALEAEVTAVVTRLTCRLLVCLLIVCWEKGSVRAANSRL